MNKIVTFAVTACCILLPYNLSAEEYSTRVLVTATEEATLSSELAAKVDSIPIDEGSKFKESDILIKFDCSFYEETVRLLHLKTIKSRLQLQKRFWQLSQAMLLLAKEFIKK